MAIERHTDSAEATQELAKELLETILNTKVVLLNGPLGSGKTTFTKGIAKELGITSAITSPTYTYQQRYELPKAQGEITHLVHFDLYRLPENPDHPAHISAEIGLIDALEDPKSLVIIEWPERLKLKEGLEMRFDNSEKGHRIAWDLAEVC